MDSKKRTARRRPVMALSPSKFKPPPNLARLILLCKKIDINECPHNIYPSQSAHINHILWFLYSDRSLDITSMHRHCSVLMPVINAKMCINCINLILSTVHFSDIIRLNWMDPCFDDAITTDFRDRLWCNLMRHPKSHRIFAKSFPVSKDRFELSLSMGKDGDCAASEFFLVCLTLMGTILENETLYQEQRTMFMRTLCLSVNHWSKYQLLFFINHLYWQLTRMMNEYRERKPSFPAKYNPIRAFGSRFHELICWRATRYGRRYGMDTLRRNIQDHDTLPGIYDRARDTRLALRRGDTQYVVVNFVKCGCSGCARRGGQYGKGKIAMKVCRQCKMTYYCSRKCQKRDWKHMHRQRCSILREYYHRAV